MSKRTLLLIDVQRNMLLPPQPVPDAPTVGPKIAQILERARRSDAMVVHVRNNGGEDDPDAPGTTGWELIHDVAGHETVVDKRTPNGLPVRNSGACSRTPARSSSSACRASTASARHRSPPCGEAWPSHWCEEHTPPMATGSAPRRK